MKLRKITCVQDLSKEEQDLVIKSLDKIPRWQSPQRQEFVYSTEELILMFMKNQEKFNWDKFKKSKSHKELSELLNGLVQQYEDELKFLRVMAYRWKNEPEFEDDMLNDAFIELCKQQFEDWNKIKDEVDKNE